MKQWYLLAFSFVLGRVVLPAVANSSEDCLKSGVSIIIRLDVWNIYFKAPQRSLLSAPGCLSVSKCKSSCSHCATPEAFVQPATNSRFPSKHIHTDHNHSSLYPKWRLHETLLRDVTSKQKYPIKRVPTEAGEPINQALLAVIMYLSLLSQSALSRASPDQGSGGAWWRNRYLLHVGQQCFVTELTFVNHNNNHNQTKQNRSSGVKKMHEKIISWLQVGNCTSSVRLLAKCFLGRAGTQYCYGTLSIPRHRKCCSR